MTFLYFNRKTNLVENFNSVLKETDLNVSIFETWFLTKISTEICRL